MLHFWKERRPKSVTRTYTISQDLGHAKSAKPFLRTLLVVSFDHSSADTDHLYDGPTFRNPLETEIVLKQVRGKLEYLITINTETREVLSVLPSP